MTLIIADELFAAGIIPDIVMSATPIIFRYTDYDLEYDIEPLIKDHNFDLSQLDPVAVESVKTASQSDVLTGLPWTMHINGLYYNTDIFDQLGLDYPHDGMTWTELRELATHLSRSDAGIQFRGLEPDKTSEIGSILGLSLIDAETMTATIDNDGWRYVFELLESIYSIPGNDHPAFAAAAWDQFVQEQNLAMLTPFANNLPLLQEVEGLNWDIAQYPSFDEYPNLATQVDAWVLHITKHSKHKNEAFQAIATVLSEDVQSELAKNGRVPVLTDDSVQEVFGQNLSYLEGKNLEALFKSQQAKALPVTRYDGTAQGIISNAIIRVVQDGIDINTALREAEEELNGVIQDGEAGN